MKSDTVAPPNTPVRARGPEGLAELNAYLQGRGFAPEDAGHMRWFTERKFTFLCIHITPPEKQASVGKILDLPALRDERFATNLGRVRHRAELEAAVSKAIGAFDREPLLKLLEDAGVPATPVNTVDQVMNDPQTAARQMIERVLHPRLGEIPVIGTPVKFSRMHDATITRLADHSLLYTGDNFYREEYSIECPITLESITAIKLEVLPDPNLPKGGPGRSHAGGFLLTEFNADAWPADGSGASQSLTLENATADSAEDRAKLAIDGKMDTHWGVGAGEATARTIVFHLKDAAKFDGDTQLAFHLIQNYFEAVNLGRVRISVTNDANDVQATGVSPEVEAALLIAPEKRRWNCSSTSSASARSSCCCNCSLGHVGGWPCSRGR